MGDKAGHKTALIVSAIGAGAIALVVFRKKSKTTGKDLYLQSRGKSIPKKSANPKAKYAEGFGVPVSLFLATLAIRGKKHMALATAKEMWPKVSAKFPSLKWDKTDKGLNNAEVSAALTAAYLGQWWDRYAKNPSNWMLTAYAYNLGPGRVRKVVPKDNGKLPKPLPPDFERIRKLYANAIKTPEVAKSIGNEKTLTVPTVGDPLIWTPSAVKAEFDRIRNVLDTVNKEMSLARTNSNISDDEWQSWFKVYNTGHSFVDTASTYWGSNVDVARQHEANAAKWRATLKTRGATMIGPKNMDKPATTNALGWDKSTAALAVGGVVGLALLVGAAKH